MSDSAEVKSYRPTTGLPRASVVEGHGRGRALFQNARTAFSSQIRIYQVDAASKMSVSTVAVHSKADLRSHVLDFWTKPIHMDTWGFLKRWFKWLWSPDHQCNCWVCVCAYVLMWCNNNIVSRDHFVYAPSKWETTLQFCFLQHSYQIVHSSSETAYHAMPVESSDWFFVYVVLS